MIVGRSLSKNIGLGVLLAGLLSIAALFAGVLFMAAEQNRQAALSERQMLEGGYKTWISGLKSLTQDYAWWDDLLIATGKDDTPWFDTNVKTVVVPNATTDFLAVLDHDLKPVYAWDKVADGVSDPRIVDQRTIDDLRKVIAASETGKMNPQTMVGTIRGAQSILSFTRIYPTDPALVKNPADLPYLVMGYHIVPERIAALGEQFLIQDLVFMDMIAPMPHHIPVTQLDGNAIGYLTWTAAKPGTAVVKKAVLPISAITLLLFAGVAALSIFARRQAGRLASQEAEANAQVKLAQAELIEKTKMASLGQLTATVAHEIRNPLGSVRTSAFLLRKKLGDQDGFTTALDRIDNGILRCDNIISQLLDFARSNDFKLLPAKFDDWLEKVMKEEVENLSSEMEVVYEPGAGGSEAAFDAERLRRVLVNLLNNATEAMRESAADGGGQAKPTRITVRSRLTSRGFEVDVSDTGPGMDSATMAAIFEPFFTTKSFGTGLGLPACLNIMKYHNGGLEVQSQEGKGAVFTFWLPPAAQELAA
jgi:signal transduction histidine kinase